MNNSFIILCVLAASASSYEKLDIVSGRIESCRGCSLNRLPEVKQFVMQDAASYDRLEVKFISGAQPELVLLGEGDRELDRIDLSHMNRQQCNDLLQDKGFVRKEKNTEF